MHASRTVAAFHHMNQTLRVSFESPQSGWMSLSLKAGRSRLAVAASYRHYNSLHDLIESLTALLGGQTPRATVRWNCEPEQYDFRFTADSGNLQLDVIRYPDHLRRDAASRTVFSFRAPALDVCGAFWRELRGLRRRILVDEFDRNWRREFPHAALREFTRLLRSQRRASRTAATRMS